PECDLERMPAALRLQICLRGERCGIYGHDVIRLPRASTRKWERANNAAYIARISTPPEQTGGAPQQHPHPKPMTQERAELGRVIFSGDIAHPYQDGGGE